MVADNAITVACSLLTSITCPGSHCATDDAQRAIDNRQYIDKFLRDRELSRSLLGSYKPQAPRSRTLRDVVPMVSMCSLIPTKPTPLQSLWMLCVYAPVLVAVRSRALVTCALSMCSGPRVVHDCVSALFSWSASLLTSHNHDAPSEFITRGGCLCLCMQRAFMLTRAQGPDEARAYINKIREGNQQYQVMCCIILHELVSKVLEWLHFVWRMISRAPQSITSLYMYIYIYICIQRGCVTRQCVCLFVFKSLVPSHMYLQNLWRCSMDSKYAQIRSLFLCIVYYNFVCSVLHGKISRFACKFMRILESWVTVCHSWWYLYSSQILQLTVSLHLSLHTCL